MTLLSSDARQRPERVMQFQVSISIKVFKRVIVFIIFIINPHLLCTGKEVIRSPLTHTLERLFNSIQMHQEWPTSSIKIEVPISSNG